MPNNILMHLFDIHLEEYLQFKLFFYKNDTEMMIKKLTNLYYEIRTMKILFVCK